MTHKATACMFVKMHKKCSEKYIDMKMYTICLYFLTQGKDGAHKKSGSYKIIYS